MATDRKGNLLILGSMVSITPAPLLTGRVPARRIGIVAQLGSAVNGAWVKVDGMNGEPAAAAPDTFFPSRLLEVI